MVRRVIIHFRNMARIEQMTAFFSGEHTLPSYSFVSEPDGTVSGMVELHFTYPVPYEEVAASAHNLVEQYSQKRGMQAVLNCELIAD